MMRREQMMMGGSARTMLSRGVAVAAMLAVVPVLLAATPASSADREFVGKVSQGGLYEVEAGKVAAMRGQTGFVKDFGATEVHDHTGVNAELHKIAAATGVSIAPGLNAEFTERLNKLKAVPAGQFDSYYVGDMKQIHDKDEGLFVKESQEGSDAYKEFAHGTAVIVKGHIGALGTV